MTVKHSKGCNCKKTLCSKKYCECYQAGIKCTDLCKCEECRNCEIQQSDKNLFYYHKMKHEEMEENERQNIVKLEKNKNLFKNFVGVNNNKIKMNFFNCLGETTMGKEQKLFRDRNSPIATLKYEENH